MSALAAVLALNAIAVGALPALTRDMAPANLNTTETINNGRLLLWFNANPTLDTVNLTVLQQSEW